MLHVYMIYVPTSHQKKSLATVCSNLREFALGDQGPVWQEDPPRVLHLCLLHQPDCDDVTHHCRHCGPQQVSLQGHAEFWAAFYKIPFPFECKNSKTIKSTTILLCRLF